MCLRQPCISKSVYGPHPSLAYFSIDGTQRRLPLATNQCIILNCLLHFAGYIDPFPCMQPLTAAILPNHDLLSKVLDDSIKMFAILSHCSQSVSQLTELALFSLLQRFLSLSTSQCFEAQPCKHFTRQEIGVPGCQGKGGAQHASFRAAPASSIPCLDHSLFLLQRHHCAFAASYQSYLL